MTMKYKMIVLDLDGTLTNSKKEMTLAPARRCSGLSGRACVSFSPQDVPPMASLP